MTAADKLREMVARNRPFPVSDRMIRDRFVRAYYYGHWKRQNRATLVEFGWGRSRPEPEWWDSGEFLLAEADYYEAERLHREIITDLWRSRALDRAVLEAAE